MTTIVLAAHPDDETAGVGGSIAKLSKEEDVFSVILSFGDIWPPWREKDNVISERTREAKRAARILGVKKTYFMGLRENKVTQDFDSEKQNQLKEIFEKHKPDKVFYHSEFDGHPVHLAANNLIKNFLKTINYEGKEFKYEINLWNWFKYNPFFIYDITETFETKMKALNAFKSQWVWIRPLELIMRAKAVHYGKKLGVEYGESFHLK